MFIILIIIVAAFNIISGLTILIKNKQKKYYFDNGLIIIQLKVFLTGF